MKRGIPESFSHSFSKKPRLERPSILAVCKGVSECELMSLIARNLIKEGVSTTLIVIGAGAQNRIKQLYGYLDPAEQEWIFCINLDIQELQELSQSDLSEYSALLLGVPFDESEQLLNNWGHIPAALVNFDFDSKQ